VIATLVAGVVRLVTGCAATHDLGATSAPRVYFANHTSNLDALVVWASFPESERRRCRMVAARDYWGAGPIRRFISVRALRAILIERHNVTRENNPLVPICAALREGAALIIFPEGTRRDDDTPGSFLPGIFHIARDVPGAEFVPVYLENMNRILPKGEFLLVPIIGSVRFGAPLSRIDGETKAAFLERARLAIVALREE